MCVTEAKQKLIVRAEMAWVPQPGLRGIRVRGRDRRWAEVSVGAGGSHAKLGVQRGGRRLQENDLTALSGDLKAGPVLPGFCTAPLDPPQHTVL